ncbi:hypothetical protein DPEC_G00042670 [Dallia pectoralis]|uniref:Uncharacterized protein n=1 Tax=Dallia pectoralis TaxID=75939 RepID=A0ACC2HA65_DALPE|nr:hypothetical protein DPEC_G00042670 [Dallia pectoralis]
MTAKHADAAAELAVKEAHYQMLLEEERQKELIRELEEQQRKALEAQKRELERLQAEKEIRAARAKLESYNKETEREKANYVKEERNVEAKSAPLTASPPPLVASPCHTGIPSFAQIFQDSIALNRLPVPEPYVFNGDPIQFIEWKSAFTSLIDQRVITPAEKLYYLKKYVGGPARQVLEGTFYRNDNEAYQDAWNKLNHRFGQPFAIQRAFREKLNSWPRISPKDAEGLRRFSDFLNACQDAMPHLKDEDDITFLNILDESIRKNIHGHYEMPLPFKTRPSLPDNKDSATTRLRHLKRKLQRDERYKEHYVEFMEEVIRTGDAEEVKDGGSDANRVQKIQLSSVPQQWRYVPTNENPADHASRGLTAGEFLSSTWLTGPKFLWEQEIRLATDDEPELTVGDPEVRSVRALSTKTKEHVSLIDRLSKFSSWSLATRAVARILRRISKNCSNSLTTVTEREGAERCLIKDLQKDVYQEEL